MSRPAATNAALWTVQTVLAALFLFAGGMKLLLPVATFTAQSPLPGWLIRAVGVLEVAGALGLILPGVLRHLPSTLTSLAAGGLLLIMCGAVGATLASPATATNPVMVVTPIAVGFLATVVAYGRARPARLRAA